MRARGWLIVGIATAAALLLLGRAVTTLVVEHAWFSAMGAPALWWERATDTVLLQGGAWLVGSLFAFANLHAVRSTILAVAVPSRVANIELTAIIPGRRLLSITVVLAGLIGLGLAAPLTNWTDVAMARHGIAFGEIEGFLDRDLGFYVYWLPLEETMYVWALVSVVAIGTMVMVLYALTRSLRLEGRRVTASSHVRRHLSALGAIVLILLAWSYRLDSFDLLRSGSGQDGLFLRVDHLITLRVDLFMSVLSGLAAIVLFRAGWIGQSRVAFLTLTVVLGCALGLRHVLPAFLVRGSLIGEPAKRDLDYLATRTLVSRRAYDVDAIHGSRALQAGLTTLVRRGDLAKSISVWDASILQTRTPDDARNTVVPTHAAWVVGEAGNISALVVRRPLNGASRWLLTVVDATQPVVRDSSIDLTADASDLDSLREPAVAPGLRGHRLMADPNGTVLGTPLNSTALRIAHAWAARDPDLLDGPATSEAPAVYVSHRDVRERLTLLAPIFAQSDEVLPLVHDGTLYWTVNLYSTSDGYPLSQHWQIGGEVRSYFRFAATALVEANSGRVRFISADHPDPIARTWMARVPSLFVKASDLPPTLVDRLPPATESAIAQLRTFARYGSRLDGPVPRQLPDSAFAGDGPPAHVITADSGAVVAWSVPLLDRGDQLTGVMTAVGGRYRRTYWDSTTGPRQRWSTITEQLRASLDSSRALVPDGSRREPRMRPGRVQVVMSDHGPVLIQPLQWNRADGTPVVTRVAVGDEGRVGIGATVAEAVMRVGSPRTGTRPLPGATPVELEPRDAVLSRLYESMRQGMRSGNWTRFGAAFDSLGNVLGRPPQ